MAGRTIPLSLLITGFVLLWNSGFIAAEYAIPYTGTFSLLFWRYLALTVVLLAWLKFRGKTIWPGWEAARHASITGVLAHGGWLGGVLLALEYDVAAGIIALIVALQPLATGAFSGVIAGERTSWRQWIGLVLGFVGVTIAVSARMTEVGGAPVVGYLFPFGSVIVITIASLLQRKRDLTAGLRPLPVTTLLFFQSLATALFMAIPAVFAENLHAEWNPSFIAAMAWLVLVVSMGAYGLMWVLIERTDATRVASLFYLGPPVTMVMAWIAFGDKVTGTDLIGMAVTAIGIYIVHKPGRMSRSTG